MKLVVVGAVSLLLAGYGAFRLLAALDWDREADQ